MNSSPASCLGRLCCSFWWRCEREMHGRTVQATAMRPRPATTQLALTRFAAKSSALSRCTLGVVNSVGRTGADERGAGGERGGGGGMGGGGGGWGGLAGGGACGGDGGLSGGSDGGNGGHGGDGGGGVGSSASSGWSTPSVLACGSEQLTSARPETVVAGCWLRSVWGGEHRRGGESKVVLRRMRRRSQTVNRRPQADGYKQGHMTSRAMTWTNSDGDPTALTCGSRRGHPRGGRSGGIAPSGWGRGRGCMRARACR